MECEDCEIAVVSEFQGCDECAFCQHDESITRCKSYGLAIFIGILIGLTPLVIIMIIIMILVNKFYKGDNLLHRMFHHCGTRKQRRLHKKRAICDEVIMSRLVSGHLPLRYPDITGMENPAVPSAPVEDVKPMECEVPIKDQSNSNKIDEAKKLKSNMSNNGSYISTALLGTLLVGNAIHGARACDDMVFLSSSGQLFEDEQLRTIRTGITIFKAGSSLCIKDQTGNEEMFKLTHISLIESYAEMYKACRPILESGTGHACLGSDGCWDGDRCKLGYRRESIGGKVLTVPKEQVGCLLVPNLSTWACTYKQICVWYWWDVQADLKSCDKIYKKVDETARFHFEYTSDKKEVRHFTLSSNSPVTLDPVTFYLSSHYIEAHNTYDKIRKHEDLYMGTYAAEINQAIPGLLGDMQVQLGTNNKTLYPTHAVKCGMSAHEHVCTMPESSYDRSLQMDSRNVLNVSPSALGVVVRSRKVEGTATILFKLKYSEPIQVVNTTVCSIKVISTFGCTGCTSPAFIVLQPYDVKVTGLIPFKSNCSFLSSDLICSGNLQRLVLNKREPICEIKSQSGNITLNHTLDSIVY